MSCLDCKLKYSRRNKISPAGNKSSVMLIGLSPNYTDDVTGIPFTGMRELLTSDHGNCLNLYRCFGYYITHKPSKNWHEKCQGFVEGYHDVEYKDDSLNSFYTQGQFLNKTLRELNIDRDELYLTYAVKCKPYGVRNPTTDEINCCRHILDAEIREVEPKVIVCFSIPAGFAVTGKMEEKYGKINDNLYLTYGIEEMLRYNRMTMQAYNEKNPKAKEYKEEVALRGRHIRETLKEITKFL